MESYQIGFTAVQGKKQLPATGDLFVYESASVALNAETRIRVKPDNGGVVILRPGQWFRNPDKVTQWSLESFNGNDVIDAVFVIGYGEFGDANTLNKFTLDATLTNNVSVTNTPSVGIVNSPADRLYVSLDTTQLLNVAGQTVQYTNAHVHTGTAAYAATWIFTAAQNPNGAYLELVEVACVCAADQGVQYMLLANATLPASSTDGDTLYAFANGSQGYDAAGPKTMSVINDKQTTRIKIAAGKGLAFFQAIDAAGPKNMRKSVLYTLL